MIKNSKWATKICTKCVKQCSGTRCRECFNNPKIGHGSRQKVGQLRKRRKKETMDWRKDDFW